MNGNRKQGRLSRVSNGRHLHLASNTGAIARAAAPAFYDEQEEESIPLGFRPVLLSPQHEESALEIAAFVGRLLAERHRPTSA